MEGSDLEPAIPGLVLHRVLGRGASADVYLATQERFGRQVAVKVLTTRGTEQAERRMFATECRTLGQLSSHPDIVTVYDGDVTADGRPYLVMEYLPGGTLAERLREEGRLDPEEVVAIGVKLAGALATAHAHGIVHGDVKPQNVLRSSSGNPVLADFGIARFVGGSATSTRLGAVTPLHAAPELLDGSPPDVRTDVYELASTLFELLDGSPAAGEPDEGPLTVIARIARRERRHLDASGLPEGLAEVIEAGMAFDPDDRPATMVDLGARLIDVGERAGFAATEMVVLDAVAPDRGDDGARRGPVAIDHPTLPPEDLVAPGPPGGRKRGRLLVPMLAAVLVIALGTWWVLRPSGTGSAGGTATTTTTAVSVPAASGPVDVTMTVPGTENLSPRLDSQLTDTSVIFAPVGTVTAVAPTQGSGFYQTPMRLRYDAINPLKEPGCGGFTSDVATLQGIWQRTVDYKDSSRVQVTVMAFETEAQARESFLVFSVMQGPTAQECLGFEQVYGLGDSAEADIVHRDPPLTITAGGTRYNSFTLSPSPERPDLTTVIATVVQRGRDVVVLAAASPASAPSGLDQRVAATVDNVLSRI